MSTTLHNGKPLLWPSMTSPMDVRSQPDSVPWGRWRHVLNVRAVENGRACRREGWRRYGHQTGHTNSDLHFQHGPSQVIRSLFGYKSPSRTNSGNRIFAGTQTDLWLNRMDGGWRNVGQNLPAAGEWSFAGLNDIVVGGNAKSVLWTRVDLEGFAPIPSLDKIKLTGAAVVWAYQGTIFLADVVMDGVDAGHRIVWADQNSIEFEPTTDSIAGFKDLTPGERILAAVPTGTAYTILTTHGAWRQGVVDGQFAFQQLYFSKDRDACPVNSRAITTNREIAYFVATDGIYALTPYSTSPEWVDWMNRGLPESFTSADRCVITASAYDPSRNELLFSSASLGLTYVVNTRNQSSSIIDHGFTALLVADVDRGNDMAMWWVSTGICAAAEVDANYPVGPRDDVRRHPEVIGGASSCSPFDAPCDDCDGEQEFIAASATDGCLKVFDSHYYARDRRTSNSWAVDGYATRFVTGANWFGIGTTKRVSQVTLDFTAQATDVPGKIQLFVGTSGSPVDPIHPEAKTLSLSSRTLAVPKTAGGNAPNIRPLQWVFISDGRFLWLDLRIPVCTGAAVCFSSLTAHVGPSPNSDQ